MDLRKIIKEEVEDFGWTEDIQPQLKTYRVTYRMEMYINAYDETEAEGIWEQVDLNCPPITNEGEPGVSYVQYVETASGPEEDVDDGYRR